MRQYSRLSIHSSAHVAKEKNRTVLQMKERFTTPFLRHGLPEGSSLNMTSSHRCCWHDSKSSLTGTSDMVLCCGQASARCWDAWNAWYPFLLHTLRIILSPTPIFRRVFLGACCAAKVVGI